jgi:hypothetical protein
VKKKFSKNFLNLKKETMIKYTPRVKSREKKGIDHDRHTNPLVGE